MDAAPRRREHLPMMNLSAPIIAAVERLSRVLQGTCRVTGLGVLTGDSAHGFTGFNRAHGVLWVRKGRSSWLSPAGKATGPAHSDKPYVVGTNRHVALPEDATPCCSVSGCPRPGAFYRSSFRIMAARMGRLVLSFRSTTHHSVQTTGTAGSVPATYEEDQ